MKKIITVIVIAIVCSFSASAEGWGNRWGFDFRYGTQHLTTESSDYTSSRAFGVNLNFKQIQFHKRPIGGMVYVGLDLGLSCDVATYSQNQVDGDYQRGGSLLEGAISTMVIGQNDMLCADFGAFAGPYVKVAPLAASGNTDFRVSAYYHIIPSLSGIVSNDSYAVAYNPYNSIGALVGWKFVSVGYEIRHGQRDYTIIDPNQIGSVSDVKDMLKNGERNEFASTTKCIFLRLSF